jgi:hypothetical protein
MTDSYDQTDRKQAWHLRLYVAGKGPSAEEAVNTVPQLLRRCPGALLEICDIHEDSTNLDRDGIVSTPTLVRLSPHPRRTAVGPFESAAAVWLSLASDAGQHNPFLN